MLCLLTFVDRKSSESGSHTLAELSAGELGYGVLEVESRFSVEENVACSCFSREGKLEALQLGFTPTSRSGDRKGHGHDQAGDGEKRHDR